MRLLALVLLMASIPSPALSAPPDGGAEAGKVGTARQPVHVTITGRCHHYVGDRIYFDYGTATIKPISFPWLDWLIAELKQNPKITRVMITGHTDSSEPNAAELSWLRATAVSLYLKKHSADPRRLETFGYGFRYPWRPNNTPDNRAVNRRVDFWILERNGQQAERIRPRECSETLGQDPVHRLSID